MSTKNLYLLLMLLFVATLQGQHNYDNESVIFSENNQVGIGTEAPNSKLHVYENEIGGDVAITIQNRATWDPNATSSLLFNHNVNNFNGGKISSIREGNYLTGDASTANSSLAFFTALNGVNQEHLRITKEGKIGLGTNTPQSKLHIFENIIGGDVAITVQNRATWDPNATSSLIFSHNVNNFNGGKISSIREGNYLTGDTSTANSSLAFFTTLNGTNQEHLRITKEGKVGIGTSEPGDFKLAVEGIIGAREIGVTLDENWKWPDYVFKSDYNLPSLKTIKTYIDKNGHLPEIPSEIDVKENGLKLAELNTAMLKKIEELTLYLIQQNETIEQQNKDIKELRKELTNIKNNLKDSKK
ncbi:hypothetical protein ABW636_13170 [Aquimarina sp. 2201CG1-2-11]|uniref:hypothetical protein n=1 Tax=Aquimarina discodermiae TaxID=3231043 RepID=UPI0034630A64